MGVLRLENASRLEEAASIGRELAPLGVRLERWEPPADSRLRELLGRAQLDDTEKEEVLRAFEDRFEVLKRDLAYQERDLIVLHEGTPGLDGLMSKFDRCHTHDDDEVRYVVDGSGVFGFVRPDGSQVELEVTAGDYINVPAGTEHWFYLTGQKRIKALRYFISTDGWAPRYTDTPIRIPRAAPR